MKRENNEGHTAMNSNASVNGRKEEELKEYRFALIPKSVLNEFFHEARDGCVNEASRQSEELKNVNVKCIFIGPNTTGEGEGTTQLQIDELDGIIQNKTLWDGVAIAVNNAEKLTEKINDVIDAGIPVITFDSDAPESQRSATIGTDNTAFGKMLGKVLLQIAPEGGTYSIISSKEGLNLKNRVKGLRDKLNDTWGSGPKWELNDIYDGEGSTERSLAVMKQSMVDYPNQNAVIPVGLWPMINTASWNEFVTENKNLITVVGDASDQQIQSAKTLKVNALVGQMPYLMGKHSISMLMDKVHHDKDIEDLETDLLQIVRAPSMKFHPIDHNQIGYWKVLPYSFYTIILGSIIVCGIWTWKNRKSSVVKSSQPVFLWLILFGTLSLSSTLIPISIDDQFASPRSCDIACQICVWFPAIGITIIFAALFSKSWRLWKILHYSMKCRLVVVTIQDVIVPFIVLLVANVAVLLTWNIHDPLQFKRKAHEGTDSWNRITSTHGSCQSKHAGIYGYVLFSLSLVAMILASIATWQIRKLKTAINESSYIGVVVIIYVQAMVVGAPLFHIIMRDRPQFFVPIISFLIFIVCMATLLLIFLPKVKHHKKREKLLKQSRDKQNTNLAVLRHRAGEDSDRTKLMKFVNMSLYAAKEEKVTQSESLNLQDSKKLPVTTHNEKKIEHQEGGDNEEVGLTFKMLTLYSPRDDGEMENIKRIAFKDEIPFEKEDEKLVVNEDQINNEDISPLVFQQEYKLNEPHYEDKTSTKLSSKGLIDTDEKNDSLSQRNSEEVTITEFDHGIVKGMFPAN